mmetsp:Transcript_39113/g.117091  ORF Transcript_39113/g.117091 Transcript_39113/m.117091 type:complete len:338 (+) Transcript_39113:707-1720(+)
MGVVSASSLSPLSHATRWSAVSVPNQHHAPASPPALASPKRAISRDRARPTSPERVPTAPPLALISAIPAPRVLQWSEMAALAPPASTPHSALKTLATQSSGKKRPRCRSRTASISQHRPMSTATSPANRQRRVSPPSREPRIEAAPRFASIPAPSRQIHCSVAAAAVAVSSPTPRPANTRDVASTFRSCVVRSWATCQNWYRRYSCGTVAGQPAGSSACLAVWRLQLFAARPASTDGLRSKTAWLRSRTSATPLRSSQRRADGWLFGARAASTGESSRSAISAAWLPEARPEGDGGDVGVCEGVPHRGAAAGGAWRLAFGRREKAERGGRSGTQWR